MRKHILFISSWYPNRKDPSHGIFNKYFSQAAALYNNISVLNVCSEKDLSSPLEIRDSEDESIYTVEVYYRKVKKRFSVLSLFLKRKRVLDAFSKGFERVIKKSGMPDVIHLNVVMPMGVVAYHLSRKFGIPLVVNENWSGYTNEDGNYKGWIRKYFTRRIIKHAQYILPTSMYLQGAMQAHGLAGRYKVIPNVVNVHVFKPGISAAHTGTNLIHISSLNDREKNVSGLIRAFADARKHKPDLSLRIVGDGVDRQKYVELVKELGLDNSITFAGKLYSGDLVKEINKSDALIMFSNYETFCLVIIEAFACGKPVITSNAGAIKTYMKPELGIMVKVGDEPALSQAIINFSREKERFSSDYIRAYAVENYSYEKVGKQLDEIYEMSLKKSREA